MVSGRKEFGRSFHRMIDGVLFRVVYGTEGVRRSVEANTLSFGVPRPFPHGDNIGQGDAS